MKEETETFQTVEDVEKEVEELEKQFGLKLQLAEKTEGLDPAGILDKVCAVLTIAGPVLKFLKKWAFFSKKFQSVIQKIIDLPKTICPQP